MNDLSLTEVANFWPQETNHLATASLESLEAMLQSSSIDTSDTSISEHSSNFLEEWPQPEDLGSGLPSVPEFDTHLLPESLRPLVEDVSDRMQVSADFPAIVAIAVLAGLTNRRALIQPKRNDHSWRVVPNLWGALVAGPGLMKSPVIACMTQPARAIETEWRAEYESALEDFAREEERSKLDQAVWAENYKRAKKSGRDTPDKPEASSNEPLSKRLITTDATFESLQKLMAENPAGVFMLRDELSGWLAGLDRAGREQERAFSLECWNGDAGFTVDRIGRGCTHVEHACLSLFGGIQPGRLRAHLSDALRDGPTNDGLLQRFQLLVWPDVRKGWKYIDRSPDARARALASTAYRKLASMNCENPAVLNFSESAQSLFVEWLTRLEEHIRDSDTSVVMAAHLAKYRKLMPALSLLFSLADDCFEEVSLLHAQQAADLCEYLEKHATRVYASKCSPERLAAISLAKRIQAGFKRTEMVFTLRDVYNHHWAGLAEPDEARAALRELEAADWVRRPAREEPRLGRPTEAFAINPRIYSIASATILEDQQ